MANAKGVFVGSKRSACRIGYEVGVKQPLAQEFGRQIVTFYRHNENQLAKLDQPSLRLPCSTEIPSGFRRVQSTSGLSWPRNLHEPARDVRLRVRHARPKRSAQ
ncbi:MAG: hypothetical protein R3C05_26755 [Pirellulaceae bacterium]